MAASASKERDVDSRELGNKQLHLGRMYTTSAYSLTELNCTEILFHCLKLKLYNALYTISLKTKVVIEKA